MATRKRTYWESVKKSEGGVYKKGEERIEDSGVDASDVLVTIAIVLAVQILLAVARAAM